MNTLGLYAQVIASKTDHGAALDGIVGASDWAADDAYAKKATVSVVSGSSRSLEAKRLRRLRFSARENRIKGLSDEATRAMKVSRR
jgi:hypothetical protein